MKYKKGYKYQIHEDFEIQTGIKIQQGIYTHFIRMTKDGFLTIKKGYAWDGATKAIDTKSFMIASLVHDAGYQLMAEGFIPKSFRNKWDLLLKDLCIKHGMLSVRAWWVYRAVHRMGGFFHRPKKIYEV